MLLLPLFRFPNLLISEINNPIIKRDCNPIINVIKRVVSLKCVNSVIRHSRADEDLVENRKS